MAPTNMLKKATFTTPSDREIVVKRDFDAPRRLVFDAWTNPKHVPRWFTGPEGWSMPICEIDLRPGGTYLMGLRGPEGAAMDLRGTYREVAPPERLVAAERWAPEWPETINTVVFAEQDGRTSVTVTILYPSKEARDMALETGMKEGMDAGYERLDEYLRSVA